jgi:parallel beta-helix repeat protein
VLKPSSNNNNISRNDVANNYYGIVLDNYSGNNNTISGNNITANNDYGIYLFYCSNTSISGNDITANSGNGISLFGSSNDSVVGNKIINNGYGIYLSSESSGNSIVGNTITNNSDGLHLEYSSDNRIVGNTITNNDYGVYLWFSSDNNVGGNSIADNGDGVYLSYSSNHNSISGNTITNNDWGMYLSGSSNCSIYGNNITTNSWTGIYLYSSSNNKLYHNNFLNNTQQVYSNTSTNVWDGGYPYGGNYWSDYTSVDLCNGPYQNETGSDGIGDTPYVIDGDNRDNYPWVFYLTTVIFDLLPLDGTQLSSTAIVFTWQTSANGTTEVFIKSETDAEYTLFIGEPAIYHAIVVGNLSRNLWYTFYARSNFTDGSAISDIRSVYIGNGIAFTKRTYDFTVERDYDQRATISVENDDSKPHDLLLTVSSPYDDLIVGFVGEGSMDKVITMNPGGIKDVSLAIHAQDAVGKDYQLTLNLTNIDESGENIRDYAVANVHIRTANVNFTIEESDTDPYTLKKTLKITNRGDAVTDLSVIASGELKDTVYFQPSITHMYISTGSTVTFEAIPVLTENFTGTSGFIIAQGAGKTVTLPINFTLGPGKSLFIGQIPRVEIEFADRYDNDDSPNTNPLDGGTVESYLINGTLSFMTQIVVDVYQNDLAAYNANVSLHVWNLDETREIVNCGVTDFSGKALFNVFGPADTYSYNADVVGFGIATETRSFTVDTSPLYEVSPDRISWLDISDSNSTFYPVGNEAVLDSSPYVFRGTQQDIEQNASVVLTLQWQEDKYKEIYVRGVIDGDTLIFNSSAIPVGNYTATIISLSSSGVALSKSVNVSCTDWSAVYKQENYTFRVPFPGNSTHMTTLEIDHAVLSHDPSLRMFDIHDVSPTESNSGYVFTYVAVSNETKNETLTIHVLTEGGELYNYSGTVHLEMDAPHIVNFTVPVLDEDFSRVNAFNITVSLGDSTLLLTVNATENCIYDARIWAGSDQGFLKPIVDFFYETKLGVSIKCGIGFALGLVTPGGERIITAIDVIHAICEKDALGAAASTVIQLSSDFLNSERARLVYSVIYYTKYNIPILEGEFVRTFRWVPLVGTAACCLLDWLNVYGQQQSAPRIGVNDAYVKNDWYCTNRPNIATKFLVSSHSSIEDVKRAYLVLHFSLPYSRDSYKPHDVHVRFNGHEIGYLSNVIPEGYYMFEVDPSYLNYPVQGVAENTVELNTEHMNGGHYVVSSEMKLVLLYDHIDTAVAASSKEEADEIASNLSSAVTNGPDPAVYAEDIQFSNSTPAEGDMITINATINNLGGTQADILARFFDGDYEIGFETISIAPFSKQTAQILWNATAPRTHNIRVLTEPCFPIQDTDETNDEAFKTINVYLPIHGVAVTQVTPHETVIMQGYPMPINVTVENQGDYTETFNVTTYASTTAIETQEITLASKSSTTIVFTWNTTGFATGNYTVWAYAEPVAGETYIGDNSYVGGTVQVKAPPNLVVGIAVENQGCNVYANDTFVNGTDYCVRVEICVENRGEVSSDSFNVSLSTYSYNIGSQEDFVEWFVAGLSAGDNVTLTYNWHPTHTGLHDFTAVADCHGEVVESDETDNNLFLSSLPVALMGDLNGDQINDIEDVGLVALSWHTSPGNEYWNIEADLNHDGYINILDIVRITLRWHQTW